MNIPIDEQIAHVRDFYRGGKMDYVLASLERLKSLDAQPVPVEPATLTCMRDKARWKTQFEQDCIDYIDTLQSALQRSQEEINKNPCCCVPDGDDGTVAHLCKWHQDKFGKAYRMQNMADSVTVENFTKLSPAKLRLFIAHGIQESTARKKAEQANRRMVELMKDLTDTYHKGII